MTDFKLGRIPDFLSAQLRVAQVGVYQHFADWFKETGLSAKQFGVLYFVQLNPGINQRTLASIQATERASMGETLSRLESKGYIARTPSPTDKRAKVVTITAEGERILEQILQSIHEQENAFTHRLDDAERHLLLGLLLKLNRRD